jgi:hypothetical protein
MVNREARPAKLEDEDDLREAAAYCTGLLGCTSSSLSLAGSLSLSQTEVEEERHTDFSGRRTNAAVDARTPQSSFIFAMST